MRVVRSSVRRCACLIAHSVFLLVLVCTPAMSQVPFTEEAVARGIDYQTLSTDPHPYGYGAAFADLDNDHDPDLILLGRGDGRVGVYENDGTGNFDDRSVGNGIPLLVGATGVTAADYDDDGDLDLHLSNFLGPDTLMRNEGNFSFTDATASAGLANAGSGTGCSWSDYDGDGWLDLYLSNYTASVAVPDAFYRNQGDGSFVDVLSTLGMPGDAPTYQAIFFDYDKDGDADLYISNDKCYGLDLNNELWENTGGTFVNVTSTSGTGACIDSMGVAVGDFDGNGEQDLYPTNSGLGNPLYLNQGNRTFVESSASAGVTSGLLGWGANFFDYDNDAYQELFVCNFPFANVIYDHDGTWPSTALSTTIGLTEQDLSFGSAVADIDDDGDLDLLVSNSPVLGDPVATPVRLYVNHEGETRRWVKFRVVGQGHNRFGIGTRVEITAQSVTQMREVITGSSYKSQSELALHFGVDDVTMLDEIDVFWPGATTSRSLQNLATNQTWTLYPPELLADADQDGDTDLDDFVVFAGCQTGNDPGALQPGCEMMDLTGDADVDSSDFIEFLERYAGPLHDCNANGIPDLQDIVDGTAGDSGNGVPDDCETSGAPAGRVDALSVGKAGGVNLALSWSGSCIAGDGDYAVYEGSLGVFYGHTPSTCSTGGATSRTITPGAGSRYYLVIPTNGAREGSHGLDGGGSERGPGGSACLPRELGTCP